MADAEMFKRSAGKSAFGLDVQDTTAAQEDVADARKQAATEIAAAQTQEEQQTAGTASNIAGTAVGIAGGILSALFPPLAPVLAPAAAATKLAISGVASAAAEGSEDAKYSKMAVDDMPEVQQAQAALEQREEDIEKEKEAGITQAAQRLGQSINPGGPGSSSPMLGSFIPERGFGVKRSG